MTVRHTPLTARLSPGASSPASGEPTRILTPRLVGLHSTTVATPSTRPVNIALYQDVGTERLNTPLEEPGRGKRPSGEETKPAGSEHARRHVEPDEIGHAFIPGRPVNRSPAFQQQGADIAGAKATKGRAERQIGSHENLGAVR